MVVGEVGERKRGEGKCGRVGKEEVKGGSGGMTEREMREMDRR